MCFTKNVSLTTYLTGCILSLFLFRIPNAFYKVIGLFFLFVSHMQLVDFLLWSRQKCDAIHRSISVFGMIIHIAQPVIISLLVLYYSTTLTDTNRKLIYATLVVYIIAAIVYGRQYVPVLQCTTPRKGIQHLIWNWTHLGHNNLFFFFYLLCIFTVLYVGFTGKNTVQFAILVIISMFLTYLLIPSKGFSSVWCTYIIIIPAIYLFDYHTKKKLVHECDM
jgi:hypothetical protein